jgi:hypothetical protein
MDMMYRKIAKWFECIATVRAASELARQGYHREAKKLLTQLASED